MRRHSFIVQVHPGGVSVVENLRTRERIRVEKLDAVGAQIERWMSDAATEQAVGSPSAERDDDDRVV